MEGRLLLEDVVEATSELNVLPSEVVVDSVVLFSLLAGEGVFGVVAH